MKKEINITEEETKILINALHDQWNQGALDYKGIALLTILELSIDNHETEQYLKKDGSYDNIQLRVYEQKEKWLKN